jgi:hypothetical protein
VKRLRLHHQRPTLPPPRRRPHSPHNTKTRPRTPDKPPAPPDPYEGVEAEWRPVYEDFAKLLVPIANKGVAVARALKQLSQGDTKGLPEGVQRGFAVVRLGQCDVPFNRKTETGLRALLASVKDTEAGTDQYLAAVNSLLAGPEKAQLEPLSRIHREPRAASFVLDQLPLARQRPAAARRQRRREAARVEVLQSQPAGGGPGLEVGQDPPDPLGLGRVLLVSKRRAGAAVAAIGFPPQRVPGGRASIGGGKEGRRIYGETSRRMDQDQARHGLIARQSILPRTHRGRIRIRITAHPEVDPII